MADVDVSDFNPAFGDPLAKFQAALAKAGIKTNIISGYRSPEYQQQLINQGIRPAAPPWRSFHQYGLAADLQPEDPRDYQRMWAMAPQFGLHALGSYDPTHIQLAGKLDDLIGQYSLQGWRPTSQPAPARGSIAYAGLTAGGPPVGAPTNAAPIAIGSEPTLQNRVNFINQYARQIGLDPNQALNIAAAEGLNAWGPKNFNAGSSVDRDKFGSYSFGDFQLNVRGGMGAAARKAGIDPADPSQWQAADRFALDQMKAGGIKPWTDPVSRAYQSGQKVAAYQPPPGVTLNTPGPAMASGGDAVAAGGSSPVSGGGQPPGPLDPSSPFQKGLTQAAKTMGIDGGDQGDEPKPIQAPPMQPAQAVGGPMMASYGGAGNTMRPRAAAEQALAQQGFLSQPAPANLLPTNAILPPNASSSPFPGFAPPGVATGVPSQGLPGTSLNSPSQLQMALLYGLQGGGSPYGYNPYGGSV